MGNQKVAIDRLRLQLVLLPLQLLFSALTVFAGMRSAPGPTLVIVLVFWPLLTVGIVVTAVRLRRMSNLHESSRAEAHTRARAGGVPVDEWRARHIGPGGLRAPTPVRRPVFDNVWYRSRPLGFGEPAFQAMEDVGTLTVEPGLLVFFGEDATLEVTDVVAVTRGRKGRDFVNNWITVTYGPNRTAMLVDGGSMGWRGILGGNRRLYEAICSAFAGARTG